MKNQINQPGLLLLGCLCAYCSICSVATGVELQLGSFQTNLVLGHEFQAQLVVSNITGMRIGVVDIGVVAVGEAPQQEIIGKVQALNIELSGGMKSCEIRGIRNRGVWPGLAWMPETTNGLPTGSTDLIFKSPGNYDIRFIVNHHLTSAVARVQVVSPEGEDRKAWEHLPVDAYLEVMSLYSGYEHPDGAYERLANKGEDLAMYMQNYGESYYGRVMSTNLFRLYLAKSRNTPPPEWLNKCYQASVSRGGNVGVMRGIYENRFNVRTTEYGRAFFKTGKRPE